MTIVKMLILFFVAALTSYGAGATELCRENIIFDPVSKTHFGWFTFNDRPIRVWLNQSWKARNPVEIISLGEEGVRLEVFERHDLGGQVVAEGILSSKKKTLGSGIYSLAGSATPTLLSGGYPVASLRMFDEKRIMFVLRSKVPHARGQGKIVTIKIDGGIARLSDEKYLPGEPLSVEPSGNGVFVVGSAGDWSWAAALDKDGKIDFLECGRSK